MCCFRQAECRNCGKVGHIAKVCSIKTQKVLKKTPKGQATHYMLQDSPPWNETSSQPASPQQQFSNVCDLFPIKGKSNPIIWTVRVNKAVLRMELDPGASVSIISEDTYKSISIADDQLPPTDVCLCTYTGETLTTLACVDVQVEYESQVITLPLIVVNGQGGSLFRQNWQN